MLQSLRLQIVVVVVVVGIEDELLELEPDEVVRIGMMSVVGVSR